MLSISQRVQSLRDQSLKGPIGQKRSSLELYALLQDCAILARDCALNPADLAALKELILAERDPANLRKGAIHSDTSVSQLVCRLVFRHGCSDRANASNASRYGKALEEAAKRGIDAIHIAGWLKQNGGVDKLFKARPVLAREVRTRYLQLTEPVTFPKHKTVALVLRMNETGHFDVMEEAMKKDVAQKAIDALHAAYGLLAEAKLEGTDLEQLPAVNRQITEAIHDLRAELLVGRRGLVPLIGGKSASADGSGDREVSQA